MVGGGVRGGERGKEGGGFSIRCCISKEKRCSDDLWDETRSQFLCFVLLATLIFFHFFPLWLRIRSNCECVCVSVPPQRACQKLRDCRLTAGVCSRPAGDYGHVEALRTARRLHAGHLPDVLLTSGARQVRSPVNFCIFIYFIKFII